VTAAGHRGLQQTEGLRSGQDKAGRSTMVPSLARRAGRLKAGGLGAAAVGQRSTKIHRLRW